MRRIAWLPALVVIATACPPLFADPDEPTASAPVEPATQPTTETAAQPTSQPATQAPTVPRVTAQAINVAVVRVVDAVAPSIVIIEVDRRPASLSKSAPASDNPWISYGAGVVLNADGRILTCQHLIDGAARIAVILHDGTRFAATRIAEDRRTDLAVIRATASELVPATIGHAEHLSAGSLVLSFGNPLGLASDGRAAVAFGIVSATDRPLPPEFGSDEDRFYGEMIQTSILAGPGSSGGPLVSMNGEIVGIVVAAPTKGGNLSPISFAVPLTQRNRRIVRDLSEGRTIEHGYLGVEVDAISQADREAANIKRRIGVRIASVFADGPADRAGLRAGDIVTSIHGKPVRSVDSFVSLIGSHTVGERTLLQVVRGGRNMLINVTLTKRPDVPDQPIPEPTMSFRGAALGPVDPAMRSVANLPEFAMLVVRVDADSPAHLAGLVPGDVIVRADGRVMDPDVVNRLLSARGDVMLGLANGASVIVKP